MSSTQQPVATRSNAASAFAGTVERALLQRLRYGLFWVIAGGGLYVTCTLALVQSRHPEAFQAHPLAPVARVILVVEAVLVLTALLMAQLASRPMHPASTALPEPGHLAAALAGGVMLLLQFAVQTTPLLLLYWSPALAQKGLNLPLMMLQRGLVLCLCAVLAYHLLLALRLQLKLPMLVAFPVVLALYLWGTYGLVKLSLASAAAAQLNDVFYWNQLPLHLDFLPRLGTEHIVGKVEPQFLAYYLTLGLIACGATLILWVPAAVKMDARETRFSETSGKRKVKNSN
jgi:hypothetical protein